MARSKRNKVVSLTKTASKGRELKSKLIQELRNVIDEYGSIYLFKYENMRDASIREVRKDWKESRIFMGKNTVAQIAFGRSVEEEYKDNLMHISPHLQGDVALLFTSRSRDEVEAYFRDYRVPEFAKAGTIPSESIVQPAGVLPFPVSMVTELRKIGMVVDVENGQLVLREPMTLAFAGVPLTPEQAKALVKLDMKLINFQMQLVCRWENGDYSEYSPSVEEEIVVLST